MREATGNASDFGYLLRHIADMTHRQLDQKLQERLGIGLAQFKILHLLANGSGQRQRRIADELSQTEASISRQIRLLLSGGLATVNQNSCDRREHFTNLTPKGIKMTLAAEEVVEEFFASLLLIYTEREQKQLIGLLDQLHRQICTSTQPSGCS